MPGFIFQASLLDRDAALGERINYRLVARRTPRVFVKTLFRQVSSRRPSPATAGRLLDVTATGEVPTRPDFLHGPFGFGGRAVAS